MLWSDQSPSCWRTPDYCLICLLCSSFVLFPASFSLWYMCYRRFLGILLLAVAHPFIFELFSPVHSVLYIPQRMQVCCSSALIMWFASSLTMGFSEAHICCWPPCSLCAHPSLVCMDDYLFVMFSPCAYVCIFACNTA